VSALATVTAERRAVPLAELDRTFGDWLGADYDLDAIHAALAAAAVNRLDGDPVWLLIVGGPGSAKTETVSALGHSGAYIVSTIASEGALLSGTSMGERSPDATGGLLRIIRNSGVLVLKDFTSILSLPPSARPSVLAALREIWEVVCHHTQACADIPTDSRFPSDVRLRTRAHQRQSRAQKAGGD
jgi:hypothetical protein